MASIPNTSPNEITYMFQSINTAEWHNLIRIWALVIILLISTLYLYYDFKAKRMEESSPKQHKKGD